MKRRVVIIVVSISCALLLLAGGFFFWQYNQAYHECYMEAGVTPTPNDFLKSNDSSAAFTADSDEINTNIPGDYNLKIKTDLFVHRVLLHIQDTIAPIGEAVDNTISHGESIEAADFVTDICDATNVEVTYATEPDYLKIGNQEVKVLLTDLGNNTTEISANLHITIVKGKLDWEAGDNLPTVDDFLVSKTDAKIVTDLSSIDFHKLGEYEVMIMAGDVKDKCTLILKDTISPSIETCDYSYFTNAKCDINKFIVTAEDATDLTYTFLEEPDINLVGEQKLVIIATDEGNNETRAEVTLTLEEDNEPPVISGLRDLKIKTGASVLFRDGVKVTDNNPEGITLDINTGAFNNNVAGEYDIVYTATDASGNKTVKTIKVSVIGKTYTEEAVWKLCDPILAKIITEDMTEREKISAIYYYVQKNLRYYSGHSTKINWIQGAVDGFVDKYGDCYIYACMSLALYERAGIKNMLIERSEEGYQIRGNHHYWNLVYVEGEGWYHCDPLPLKSGHQFLLQTNAEMQEYDKILVGYHYFDASLYPEIN